MSWQVFKLKPGEKSFILVGHGHRMHGRIWQGVMIPDCYWSLKSLEAGHPARARRLRRWRIETPRTIGGAETKNSGKDLKYLRVTTGAAASFVLRFEETIPPELLRDLRVAFGETEETSHEEPSAAAVVDPPRQTAGPGPRDGDAGDRHPTGPDEDSGHPGLEKGRKVRRSPKKKRKPWTGEIKNAARR